jgi:hypothetical protein
MDLREVIKLIKANNAANLSINTTLLPAQALKLLDLVVAQSEFLQKVTRVNCKKLKTPVPIMNMSQRNLTRVAEGTDASPSNAVFAESSNEGKFLELDNIDMFYDLLYSVVTNNEDDKSLITMIESQIAKTFANDLLDLATNGTADTYDRVYHETTNKVPMYTLAKGWIQLMKESTRTKKEGFDGEDILGTLEAVIAKMDNMYKTPECKLIISPSNLEKFNILMAEKDYSASIYLKGNVHTYLGYEMVVNPYMPNDVVLFTALSDLVFGVSTHDVQKAMEDKPRKKCIEYTYTVPADFQIARDRAMVIAYAQ